MGPYDAIVVGARCRRVADRQAAGPAGLQGPAGRSRDVSERHDLDPPHPPARRRRAAAAGGCSIAAAPPGVRAIHTYAFDMGPFVISGLARALADSPVCVRARGARCSTSCSWTPRREAGVEVREGFTVERPGRGGRAGRRACAATAKAVRRSIERARVVVGADGLHSFVARTVGGGDVPRAAAAAGGLLHLLERAADERPLRGLRSRRPRVGGLADERRPHAGVVVSWPFAAVRDEQAGHRAALHGGVRPGAGVRGADPRGASRGALPRHGRAQLLPQAVRAAAGRWSATPATTRTSSPRRGSATRSATPSCAPRAIDEWFSGARSFDAAMTRYQSARDAHVAADVRVHVSVRPARAATAADAATVRRRARQPGRDERLRPRHQRRRLARRVLRPRERRPDLRRRRRRAG